MLFKTGLEINLAADVDPGGRVAVFPADPVIGRAEGRLPENPPAVTLRP